jgi:hypothetical protein
MIAGRTPNRSSQTCGAYKFFIAALQGLAHDHVGHPAAVAAFAEDACAT